MASSSSTSVGGGGGGGGKEVLCCMCGDHGLTEELFRCRLCRVRLQHRYCSDLYPRATAYRRCNWCLREPAAAQASGGHAHEAADKPTVRRKATPSSPSSSTEEETASNSDEERKLLQEAGCSISRREAGAGLGRPVKKQKAAAPDERKAQVVTTGAAATKGNGNKKLMQAGKKTGVKQVRVKRYKLLAEVIISC
ncbi:hypothetical protein GUJ93_ZPchr0014g47498 [Zizania palustris]|uniref:PHD-type zinc finger plants domain-containing protein n=1 Tax=Zizania palustris TaxID=103762 RepID=A0A8J5TFW4_ZIZPA|nr:hypothetical protein GUJ93_ZPchr0014g47498 [Zizania palustris]